MDDFREIPRPTYDEDITKLKRQYESALKSLEVELNDLFLSDFQRAQVIVTQANIEAILTELNAGVSAWTTTYMTQAVVAGAAGTLYSLHLADSIAEARKVVQLSTLNEMLVNTVIADTQDDLLQVTNNVNRKVRNAIRKGTATSLRANITQGINGTQSLKRDLLTQWRKDVGAALDSGIVDAAGRRWKPATYAEMIARTKMLTAHIDATINEALSEGTQYGIISSHGATDGCRYHEGRIVKLDVNAPGGYPTVDELRDSGQIFHPNCKHTVSPVSNIDALSDKRKERAEQQAELGAKATATGVRNPKL